LNLLNASLLFQQTVILLAAYLAGDNLFELGQRNAHLSGHRSHQIIPNLPRSMRDQCPGYLLSPDPENVNLVPAHTALKAQGSYQYPIHLASRYGHR